MFTAQMQLVAEEMSVPLDRVRLIQCDTAVCPDQGTTSGSQSTPTNFNTRNLAQAAATAREALLRLASDAVLGVPVESAHDRRRRHQRRRRIASKRVTYGELVAGHKFNVPLDAQRAPACAREWRVLGKPVPRVDMAAMVTGTFEFVHNVRVPGMLHGAVVRPPEVGATLVRVDESSISGMPGVVKVVVRKNFVGVVAEKPWQAMQAAAKLECDVDAGRRPPAAGRLLRSPAEAAVARCVRREVDRRGREARAGGRGREGDLSASVSDARLDGHVVRGRRRAGRQGDDLVADAVRVSDAQRRRDAARHSGGKRARRVHAGRRLLRHQRRRYRVVRRRAAVAGRRQAGARAALAPRTKCVGELRLRVRDRSARRPRCRRRHRRVGLRGVVRVARRTARLRHSRAT